MASEPHVAKIPKKGCGREIEVRLLSSLNKTKGHMLTFSGEWALTPGTNSRHCSTSTQTAGSSDSKNMTSQVLFLLSWLQAHRKGMLQCGWYVEAMQKKRRGAGHYVGIALKISLCDLSTPSEWHCCLTVYSPPKKRKVKGSISQRVRDTSSCWIFSPASLRCA